MQQPGRSSSTREKSTAHERAAAGRSRLAARRCATVPGRGRLWWAESELARARATGGTFPVVGKNVLVISTVEHADDVLRAHVGAAETIKVVVPVVRQGLLDWLANDQKAFSHAERVAERTAEQLPGDTVEAVAGEADVGLAIRDALATFPADEIVVAVRPEEEEGFVESIATDTAPQVRIDGVPVRYVVIGG
jgi:hypothetical protein